MDGSVSAFDRWHTVMAQGTTDGLWELLHEDCVFWSPVVHTPQRGRQISFAYLSAAHQVFNRDFRYVREVIQGNVGILEFACMMDDIAINGVDMITCEGDQIIEFKVMIRPLKAVNMVHQKMMSTLAQMKTMAS
jgi:hypothetical protein